jgi:hypothetical protein
LTNDYPDIFNAALFYSIFLDNLGGLIIGEIGHWWRCKGLASPRGKITGGVILSCEIQRTIC